MRHLSIFDLCHGDNEHELNDIRSHKERSTRKHTLHTSYIHDMVYYWKGNTKTAEYPATSSPLLKKGGYVVRGTQWVVYAREEAILVAGCAVRGE